MLKESLHSMLPCDIPWNDPGHLIFFGFLYGVLAVIATGMGVATLMTLKKMIKGNAHH